LMAPADRDAVAAELLAYAGPDPGTSGLRREQVRALVEAGMQVGFHTLRHDALDLLSDEELARALREGRSRLEDVVGGPIRSIAYPHGRADERVARAARAAGFEHGFAGEGKPVHPDVDPLLVPRMTPSHGSAGHFALQLALALIGAGGRGSACEPPSPALAARGLALAGVLGVGAGLRFSELGARGFWRDEAVTVQLVRRSLGGMLDAIPRSEGTPPLYYVLAWGWTRLFGTSEAGLRSLSALAGTLAIGLVYLAGRELFGRRVALAAAL